MTNVFTLTLVESPFMGRHDDPMIKELLTQRNIAYARAAMRDCLLRGEAPYASHLLYTQDGVLNDDIPNERNLGIDAGLAWGQMANQTAVYTDLGISSGMKYGIQRATTDQRPIVTRSLIAWSNRDWRTKTSILTNLHALTQYQ